MRNQSSFAKLHLVELEDRSLPAGLTAIGADLGGGPHVKLFDETGAELASFFAFRPQFTGGVRVALGNINNDTVPDVIVGSGFFGATHVVVVDGTRVNQVQPNGQIADTALLASFFAFSTNLTGGVFVAAGDINNDNRDDILVGAGPGGGPQVIVVDSLRMTTVQGNGQISPFSLLGSFFAFDPRFRGGVRVAAGDLNLDNRDDIVVSIASAGPPRVIAVDSLRINQFLPTGQISDSALITSFFAYDLTFTTGVNVAVADINGDGQRDIITGSEVGTGGLVRGFNRFGQIILNVAPLRNVFGSQYTGGVRVAAVDANNDNRFELVSTGTLGFRSSVTRTDLLSNIELNRFDAFGPFYASGQFVAAITLRVPFFIS